ncbi:hypothetical protein [Paenibacillus arenilitoris]|uniref:Uncharacterized protein n=1 Tax=Paenibacillus arenilitoris TaxID=2772299 RepID=A0A927CQW8_9BACL|nr:hypothetical protein [Paenibacillus arenilitoris]MBD2870281.1 hypothetical protein [Paenibacillus arenilitoris]
MKTLNIALFTVLAAALIYVQLLALLPEGKKKEAAYYAVLMLAAVVIGSLLIAGIPVPSPAFPLRAVFEPVGRWFFPE